MRGLRATTGSSDNRQVSLRDFIPNLVLMRSISGIINMEKYFDILNE